MERAYATFFIIQQIFTFVKIKTDGGGPFILDYTNHQICTKRQSYTLFLCPCIYLDSCRDANVASIANKQSAKIMFIPFFFK